MDILTLSDDVLAIIFDICDQYYPLMKVCTRFRDLGIRLWSKHWISKQIAESRLETKLMKEWIDTHIVVYSCCYDTKLPIVGIQELSYDTYHDMTDTHMNVRNVYTFNKKEDKDYLMNEFNNDVTKVDLWLSEPLGNFLYKTLYWVFYNRFGDRLKITDGFKGTFIYYRNNNRL